MFPSKVHKSDHTKIKICAFNTRNMEINRKPHVKWEDLELGNNPESQITRCDTRQIHNIQSILWNDKNENECEGLGTAWGAGPMNYTTHDQHENA